jgi:predicted nucleic acid-binding protein
MVGAMDAMRSRFIVRKSAQAWRGGSRQALLARFLVGCDIEVFDDDQARSVCVLAGRAGTKDIVDAYVAEGALRRHDIVVSSDPDDIEAIANSVNRRLDVLPMDLVDAANPQMR